MNSHISAITQTLIIYLVMGAAYYGWGKAATHILGIGEQTSRSGIILLWLGWSFTLVIFQLSHFLFPLTAYIVVPIFIIGTAFAVPQIVNALRRFPQKRSTLMRTATIAIIMLAGTGWIASRSMISPMNYDSGLYHFNAIRWINSLPILPGLGNLHGRLAFNQSFFTYVAALNFYPLFEHGRSLANSFLLLLTIVSFVQFLRPVLNRPSLLAESHPFQYSSVLIALPILGFLALDSSGLASPTPDFASTLLQLMMFVMLAQGIAESMKGEKQQGYKATVLAVFAATAITIKLSNLAFSAVIVTICLAFSWRASGGRIRALLRILVPTSAVLLVWGVRGFILSGYPLYPSPIGHVSVDWAVPIEEVVQEAYAVSGYARQPNAYWRDALGSWEWFGPWSSRISGNIVDVVYPLVVSGVFGIIAVIVRWLSPLKKRACPRGLDWAILSPVVIGLIFWFFTAPDPRFGNALFWCLSLSSALLLLGSVQPLLKKRSFMVVVCGVFIIANLHFFHNAFKMHHTIKEVSFSGWHSIMTAPLIQKKTSSGLFIFTPDAEQGNSCWDSPLPCTPYFNPDLRLRMPGQLTSGFTVAMPQVEVAPKRPPALRTAAALYQAQCAACHGPEGHGDGPAGVTLNPSPSDFHDRHRMDQPSVHGLYSTITLGVQGTRMSGFQMLKDEERWALALYVSTLASSEADLQRGAKLWHSGIGRNWFPNLASLVTQSANDVRRRTAHGDHAVLVLAYLRLHPEAVMWPNESPLMRSARLLHQSLVAYRRGQVQGAQDLAVSAHLDGFELVEATLDTVDRRLRMTVEAEIMGYQALLKKHEAVAVVATAADRLQALLSEALQKLGVTRLPSSATFLGAFVILLREGLEVILILTAIFALLIKGERRDALPYVHAGWITALALGGITWLVAPYVVTIVKEGVTALVAAAVLLYVGFWMHGKAYAKRWHTLLHGQLQEGLSARNMWALALISFLAVYREAFEVVLFYRALWVQVAPAYVPVLGGFVSAALVLAILGWLIFRGSMRLPLGLFFGVTSLLMAALGVVFVGKGIAALQGDGTLPVNPVDIPSIPALGIYPTIQGLVLQVLVALVIASAFAYIRHIARNARSGDRLWQA